MRKLVVFNSVSLDGYFTDQSGDMSWAHNDDPEWNAFVASNASGDGVLVFGRVTYEMMAGYWQTPIAAEQEPAVADGMNRMAKIVFSRTRDRAEWANTTLVRDDPATAIRKLKSESGPDMTILGSGTIVSQLAEHGLVDEYQVVIVPIVLGSGRTMFDGVTHRLALKLMKSQAFSNGNVFTRYAAKGVRETAEVHGPARRR